MFPTAAATLLTLSLSTLTAFAAEETAVPPTVDTVSSAAAAIDFDVARLASGTRPDLSLRRVADRTFSRPRALPALYASLGALQAFDVYSTRQAIARGAQEANPVMGGVVGNPVAFTALKAASAVLPILIAERMWKTNRVAAILTMVAANSAMVIVASNNARVLQQIR